MLFPVQSKGASIHYCTCYHNFYGALIYHSLLFHQAFLAVNYHGADFSPDWQREALNSSLGGRLAIGTPCSELVLRSSTGSLRDLFKPSYHTLFFFLIQRYLVDFASRQSHRSFGKFPAARISRLHRILSCRRTGVGISPKLGPFSFFTRILIYFAALYIRKSHSLDTKSESKLSLGIYDGVTQSQLASFWHWFNGFI